MEWMRLRSWMGVGEQRMDYMWWQMRFLLSPMAPSPPNYHLNMTLSVCSWLCLCIPHQPWILSSNNLTLYFKVLLSLHPTLMQSAVFSRSVANSTSSINQYRSPYVLLSISNLADSVMCLVCSIPVKIPQKQQSFLLPQILREKFIFYLDNTMKCMPIVITISAVNTEVFHCFRTPKKI